MRNVLLSTMLTAAVAVFAFSTTAEAKKIYLSGLHSQEAVRAACGAVGGTMYGGFGRYGCINGGKGTSIDCTPGGQCTGTVPGRELPPGTDIKEVLAGIPGISVAMPPPGILDHWGVMGVRAPAATGSPVSGGARPTGSGGVILR
jgi:hypothetical protein